MHARSLYIYIYIYICVLCALTSVNVCHCVSRLPVCPTVCVESLCPRVMCRTYFLLTSDDKPAYARMCVCVCARLRVCACVYACVSPYAC